MSEIFFTSDTHFWHKNIIEYSCRPYNSIEDMNEDFIDKWNSIVRRGDIIYHLGDFALCDRIKAEFVRDRLVGTIRLIRGNHIMR